MAIATNIWQRCCSLSGKLKGAEHHYICRKNIIEENQKVQRTEIFDQLSKSLKLLESFHPSNPSKRSDGFSISIFPNPAKDEIYITGFDGEATITILDNRGSAIIENLNINPRSAIDISMLRQGVYFVEVSNSGERIIEKLVKMK